MASPRSDDEVDEIEALLMEDRDGAEAMMFDTMDGYMHAVAIGPCLCGSGKKFKKCCGAPAGLH
jgi:uncharacterized protein YchJ